MRRLTDPVPGSGRRSARSGHWSEFCRAPLAVRVYLAFVGLVAVTLPFSAGAVDPHPPTLAQGAIAAVLVSISVLNVEMSRWLSGGLARTHQPHKALSAWAFAAALLLPIVWLLVVVPLTYAHARWRGLRVPLWKWVGSAAYLVLAGAAVVAVRHLLMGESADWMAADGGRGLVTMLLAAATFLAVESILFAGSAYLGPADDEAWLRQTLRSRSFYLTEAGVLLIGGLLAAVWTGGAWFVVLFLPIYALAQRAALHEPLRVKAEAASELAARNRDLEAANQFKIDLMGVLGHEIGNPLAAILLRAELAEKSLDDDPPDRAAASQALAVIERNAMQIHRVVRDLIVLVSSDGHALRARPEPTRLHPILTAAADSQISTERPSVECAPDLRALVQPGHLEQMLGNLLVNATKYAGGATSIRARLIEGSFVEIAVSDRGPGVPAAFQQRLFERFSRQDDSADKVTGVGLGLHITRELARANGGDICHRVAHPSGADFVITLPSSDPA